MLSGTKVWFKQTITIEPYSAMSAGGEPTYGASTTASCRIVQYEQKTIEVGGTPIVSSTQIYLPGDTTITKRDRITLPDGTKPVILKVESIPGASGTTYLKVIYT